MQSRRLDQQVDIKLTLLRPAAVNHMSHDWAPSVFHMSQVCLSIFGCGIISNVHILTLCWWCHTMQCGTLLLSVMGPKLDNNNMINLSFLAEAFFCIFTLWLCSEGATSCLPLHNRLSVPALLRPQFVI